MTSALEQATKLRRQLVQVLERLLTMPNEALCASAAFVAFARAVPARLRFLRGMNVRATHEGDTWVPPIWTGACALRKRFGSARQGAPLQPVVSVLCRSIAGL